MTYDKIQAERGAAPDSERMNVCSDGQTLLYAADLARLYKLEMLREEDLRAARLMQNRFLTPLAAVGEMFGDMDYQAAIWNSMPGPVSGDCFYPKPLDDQRIAFLLADACGHGISASLISMRISSLVQTEQHRASDPRLFLQHINGDIHGLMPKGSMLACNYFVFSREGFKACGAGLPYPLLLSGGCVTELKIPGTPLGLFKHGGFTECSQTLSPGDRLLIHTDGAVEATFDEIHFYGIDRLATMFKRTGNLALPTALELIAADLLDFLGGANPDDDVTLVMVEKGGRI